MLLLTEGNVDHMDVLGTMVYVHFWIRYLLRHFETFE